MQRKNNTILIFILCILFLSGMTVAKEDSSRKGVKYDSEIITEFNSINYSVYTNNSELLESNRIEKDKSNKENKWVYVSVDVKDFSNITVDYGASADVQKEQDDARWDVYRNTTDAILSTLSDDEFHLKSKSPWGSFFSGNITKQGFDKLLNDTRVRKVYAKKNFEFSLTESISLINADDVWTSGYNGAGTSICVIDSGVDYTHTNLGGCFGTGCKVVGGYDFYNNDNNPMDDNGHGTYVAGIAASGSVLSEGVAYEANIVAMKASGSDGIPNEDALKNSLIWCYNNRNLYDISVVVMSLGIANGWGDCGEDALDVQINSLYQANIPIIAAAGNNGDSSEVHYPACNSQTISVGSVYDDNVGSVTHDSGNLYFFGTQLLSCTDSVTYADKIVCNSNRGPLLDILAPGCKITSTYFSNTYRTACGTSAAAPHVAGAAAILLGINPDMTPSDIKSTLQNTGVSVYDSDSGRTYKRIDVQAAVNSVCTIGSWTAGFCGQGSCGSNQRYYSRTVSPSGCGDSTKCEYDSSCSTSDDDPVGEDGECGEPGYDQCWEASYADCDVSLAVNHYESVNDIEWGSVVDDWDSYVIGEYQFGWKDVDAEKMYYDCDGDNDCEYGGCDCERVDDTGTMVTVTAPGTAYRKEILAYDDTSNYACWAWFNTFSPSYNDGDDPIYVLNCFDDGDCSSSQYCDKSGNWQSWDCVFKNSDGESCSSDSECSSGYCDNDGVGLIDDGWCFSPLSTYFDNQDSKCEYSTGVGSVSCDEKGAGEDLDFCSGNLHFEEECSSSCGYQDVTSVFECTDSGCYCAESLCDGLTSGDNIQTCSANETYFADKCTSIADGKDRDDNICRSSDFASGCTADLLCDGLEAGGEFCTENCSYINQAPDIYVFSPISGMVDADGVAELTCYIDDDLGVSNVSLYGNFSGSWSLVETQNVSMTRGLVVFENTFDEGNYAWSCYVIDDEGLYSYTDNYTLIVDKSQSLFEFKGNNSEPVAYFMGNGGLKLSGVCSESTNCVAPNNSMIFQNSAKETVAYIDSNGNLCLEGSLNCSSFNQTTCNPANDAFIVQDGLKNNLSYIDFNGNMCLTGGLTENA